MPFADKSGDQIPEENIIFQGRFPIQTNHVYVFYSLETVDYGLSTV